MTMSLLTVAYLVAGILFILSLGGLSNQKTARRGNLYGVAGMAIAVLATALHPEADGFVLMLLFLVVGGGVGAHLARTVEMTAMPQLVAMLHSFVGLAAVLVGFSTYADPPVEAEGAAHVVHLVEVYIDIVIGAITLTGSVLAWAKLDGRVSGKPTLLPMRHLLNLAAVSLIVALAFPYVGGGGLGALILVLVTIIAGALGLHLVAAIGGADMPVVVSLLNSYSGWTASAAGFMLSNDLLIVTGALVGSSGAILSYIMCEAMNRSIWNVVFGGFGTADGAQAPKVDGPQGEWQPIETDELAELVKDAKSVIIVPGYGMAVAQAQRTVEQFTRVCQDQGKEVRFGIHPVAGRLPGHMNVLLAEAGVPYDIVLEMDELNHDFPQTDVVLVIGANDICNPGAQTDPSSPIYGMPVLEVWKAGHVVVLKRGRGVGYAGVVNPLFFKDNTRMYFGDARDSMEKLVAALKG